MIQHPKLVLADRFQGVSRDWAGGNASSENNVSYVADSRFGVVPEFDGTAHIEYSEDNFDFKFGSDDKFTISLWVYVDMSSSGLELIVARQNRGDGYRIAYDNEALQFRTTGNGGIRVESNVIKNKWYHIAGVFDSGEGYLYVDGNLRDQDIGIINWDNYSGEPTLNVGRYEVDSGDEFHGKVQEFHIFNAALNQSDIKRVMNGLHPIMI